MFFRGFFFFFYFSLSVTQLKTNKTTAGVHFPCAHVLSILYADHYQRQPYVLQVWLLAAAAACCRISETESLLAALRRLHVLGF